MTRISRSAAWLALVLACVSACSSTVPTATPSGPPSPTGASTGTPTGSTAAPTPAGPGASLGPGETPSPGGPTPTDGAPGTPAPTPGNGTGEAPPQCAYKDKSAVGDPNTNWATMVLDTIYRLPADFAPRKLVSTAKAGMQTGFEIIPAVVDDLRAMHEASIAAGAEIAIRWAYRSYAEQQGAFGYWVRQSGEAEALTKSARPGHSEHQLGTAIDFRSADSLEAPWDYPDWATTAPGAWMGQNAWRFGFILSYPKDSQALTCYAYEPWHYRYVGRDLAKQVHNSGETLRAYLWGLAHPG